MGLLNLLKSLSARFPRDILPFAREGGTLFEAHGPAFVRGGAASAEALIRVFVANLRGLDGDLRLRDISVKDAQGRRIGIRGLDGNKLDKVDAGANLADLSKTVGDVGLGRALMGLGDPDVATRQRVDFRTAPSSAPEYHSKLEEVMAKTYQPKFYVDLAEAKRDLQHGDSVTLTVVTTFDSGGRTFDLEQKVCIDYRSKLPTIGDWYPGDGHVHTSFSDGVFGVDSRASDAAALGFSWVIMADHPQMMDLLLEGDWDHDCGAGEWDREREQCADAGAEHSVAVLNGEEVSTGFDRPGGTDSHYLAYRLQGFFSNHYNAKKLFNPGGWESEDRSGQEIIDGVSASAPGAFGVIAHPDWTSCEWVWPDARGFVGIELTSGGKVVARPVASSTRDIWIRMLKSGMRVAAVANSDSHYVYDGYGTMMTYLCMPGWDGQDQGAVYDALEDGCTVASEQGSLAVFEATTPSTESTPTGIGGTLRLSNSGPEPITLRIQAEGVDGREVRSIRLCSTYADGRTFSAPKNAISITADPNSSEYEYPPAGKESCLRIEAEFPIASGLWASLLALLRREKETVYTSPLYVSRR